MPVTAEGTRLGGGGHGEMFASGSGADPAASTSPSRAASPKFWKKLTDTERHFARFYWISSMRNNLISLYRYFFGATSNFS